MSAVAIALALAAIGMASTGEDRVPVTSIAPLAPLLAADPRVEGPGGSTAADHEVTPRAAIPALSFLHATCTIRGRALLAGAGVADGATVMLVPTAIWPSIEGRRATTTARDGSFVFDAVPSDDWVVLVSRPDLIDSFLRLPRQPDGTDVHVEPIVERGLTVTTIALDHDGRPLAGCQGCIGLLNRHDTRWSDATRGSQTMTERMAISGADGRLTWSGLAAADWRVLIEHPERPSERLAFTLTKDHCSAPATIRLGGATLHGECRLDGKLATAAKLNFPDGLGPGRPVVVSTDVAGRFAVPHLAVGPHRVQFAGRGDVAEIETRVDVTNRDLRQLAFCSAATTTTVAGTGTIVAQALDGDGLPLRTMLELAMTDAAGRVRVIQEAADATVTDATGHVTFAGLAPGDYLVRDVDAGVTSAPLRVMAHACGRVLLTRP